MKVYLAGPILDCSDDECVTWRELAKERLGAENCLDPMRRDYRTETVGGIGGVATRNIPEIIVLDKLDIRNSTALMVNYSKHSDGTAMEVFYAHSLGIPIVLFTGKGFELDEDGAIIDTPWNINHWSPWMIHHATQTVDTFYDAIATLMQWHDEGV